MQADHVQLSCLGKVGRRFKAKKQSNEETLINLMIWGPNDFPRKKSLMHVFYFGTLTAQSSVKGLWAKASLNLNGSNQGCSLNNIPTFVYIIYPHQLSPTNTQSLSHLNHPVPRYIFQLLQTMQQISYLWWDRLGALRQTHKTQML